MNEQQEIKKILEHFFDGKEAHASFDQVVKGVIKKNYNSKVEGIPYTLWQLLEHIRLTQKDIIAYIEDPNYVEKNWPDDYWPKEQKDIDDKMWRESVDSYKQDLKKLKEIMHKSDLFEKLGNEKKHRLIRELFLVQVHTSYHLGEMVTLRRLLNNW